MLSPPQNGNGHPRHEWRVMRSVPRRGDASGDHRVGDPRADPPGGLGDDQRGVQPWAAQDVQEALGWGDVEHKPVQPEPGLGAAQPGQRVMAAGAVVHEPGQEQLHALAGDRRRARFGAGAQPVTGRVPPVPVDGVGPGEPGPAAAR